MTTALGIDWSADMAEVFGADLHDVSFLKTTFGIAYDPTHPSAAPSSASARFFARGIVFSYENEMIDGESVKQGDYQVLILLGTIRANDAARATLDLGDETDNVDTVVQAIATGEDGNVLLVLVGDAVAQAGTLDEDDATVTVHYLPGSTTVADLEALIATSALLEVATAGTGANVLDVTDAASVSLAGGTDGTLSPGSIPTSGESVTSIPPGQTTAKTGRIVGVPGVSQAAVTLQVRGPSV